MRELIRNTPERTVEVIYEHDAVHATWARMPAGCDGADRHIHHEHADLFYVLAGEFTVKLAGGREVPAPTGTLVYVPPGVVHGFRNGGDTELRYLNLHAPGCGFIEYMRGRRDGVDVPFDQEDVPDDFAPDGAPLLTHEPLDVPELRVTELTGDPPPPTGGDEWFYVLDGERAGEWLERDAFAPARALHIVAPG